MCAIQANFRLGDAVRGNRERHGEGIGDTGKGCRERHGEGMGDKGKGCRERERETERAWEIHAERTGSPHGPLGKLLIP